MPHLALPALSSYLRSKGLQVIQRDLNIETYNTILTRAYLDESLARLRQDYGATARRPARPAPPRERVLQSLKDGPRLAAQIEGALRTIRSDAFLDGPSGLRALETVLDSLELASLLGKGEPVSLRGYKRFDNPYCQADFTDPHMTIRRGEQAHTIDLRDAVG